MGINGLERQFFDSMTYSKRRNSCPPQAFGFLSGPEWNNMLVQRGPRRVLQNSVWNDAHRSTNNLATADLPLKFHDVHGQNIELLNDGRRAKRRDSFCRGICFSNRPIKIGERVYLKCVATSASWSGVLRFGFTSTDPSTMQGQTLPRYACPDMTNKAGNWAKAVSETYAIAGNELFFYVTRSGNVFYGVNGEEKQLFFSGVNASVPLWALLDIYGNTSCVEFINPPLQPLNNTLNQSTVSRTPNSFTSHVSSLTVSADNMNNNRNSCNRLRNLALSKCYGSAQFFPLPFHNVSGRNVCISPDKSTVTRINDECCNGYVFTSRPIRCGEKIVIRVLSVDCSSTGGLVFGFTSCDPSNLKQTELPDDADLFLDRLEYWVVNKDVCRSPELQDELGFHLTREGEVLYSRNNNRWSTLMHVDKTLPLWAFFDIYGNVQKIQMLGTIMPQYPEHRRSLPRSRSTTSVLTVNLPPPPPQRHSMAPTTLQLASLPAAMFRCASQPTSLSTPKSQPQPVSMPATPSSINDPVSDNDTNECHVCYERPVNAVLYTCGHMCMCFECAQAVKQLKTALCPICRQEIKDVIKIYRS